MNYEEELLKLNEQINKKYAEIIGIKGLVLLSNRELKNFQKDIVNFNNEFMKIDRLLTSNGILDKKEFSTSNEHLRQLSAIEVIMTKRTLVYSGLTEIKKILDSLNQQKQFEMSLFIALFALIISIIK